MLAHTILLSQQKANFIHSSREIEQLPRDYRESRKMRFCAISLLLYHYIIIYFTSSTQRSITNGATQFPMRPAEVAEALAVPRCLREFPWRINGPHGFASPWQCLGHSPRALGIVAQHGSFVVARTVRAVATVPH